MPMNPTPLAPKTRDAILSRVLMAVERAADHIQRPAVMPADPRRILVLKSCCLGDALLATPLLGAVRRAYPDAHLVAGVGRWARPALLHNPDLDSLLDLEGVGVGRFALAPYGRVLRSVRAGHFDVALVLDRTPVLTVLPLLAGIPVRAGIDSAGRGFPLNVRVPWDAVEHEASLFLRVGAALGIQTTGAGLRFVPSAGERAAAAALWREAGLDGRRVAVLFPGGGRNPGMALDTKRWPAIRYAELGAALHDRHGLAVVLAGAADDRLVTAEVSRLMRAPSIDLAGLTTIGALGALLELCALYVGNDSGPTHLAAAVGAPVVAIFGPTDPAVYAPFTDRAVVLRGARGQSTAEVTVADALAAVARLLGV